MQIWPRPPCGHPRRPGAGALRPRARAHSGGRPSRWLRHGRRGPGGERAGAAAGVRAVGSPRRASCPRPGGTPRTPLPGPSRGRRASAAAPGPARAGRAWIAACGCAVHRGRRGFRAVQVFAGALWLWAGGALCLRLLGSYGAENKTPLPGYPAQMRRPLSKRKKTRRNPCSQLVQLTQQLAQTEQHLNNLMTQLDPLFERVTTLVGAQRELLNTKLKTIHQLLQDCKPGPGVELPEPEASVPSPEDQEAGNSQAWEEPINWSPETWNLAPSWEVEQGLRRRWHKAVAKAQQQGEQH
ncbi:coiled-coil domain-containing protein 107 isoform X1 [Meriones unguiculatus]|uniref:coiled-coil domain-containing protein 107 isoform X1 n=1 Tax=Meriones unguiculatus TaxID=10047 RepID=UPI00293EADB9|nr:coiled-coil domain-containing protein 107 isoform X1 [Meriones unguiculatus]